MYKIKSNHKGLKCDRIISDIREHGFNGVLNLLIDIDYLEVDLDKNRNGYNIKVFQDDIEGDDVMNYFRDRFSRKFSKERNRKYTFKTYNIVKNIKEERVSAITFFYKFNMFERKKLSL